MTALGVGIVLVGVFFLIMGGVGLVRFPDFYTRMHAAGKCDTLGVLLVLIGLAVYEGLSLASAKILLIAVFMFLTSPTATHAVARAAFTHSVRPWTAEERTDS